MQFLQSGAGSYQNLLELFNHPCIVSQRIPNLLVKMCIKITCSFISKTNPTAAVFRIIRFLILTVTHCSTIIGIVFAMLGICGSEGNTCTVFALTLVERQLAEVILGCTCKRCC